MESGLDQLPVIPLTVTLVVLLLLSAFFSGSETGLLSLDWLRLGYLERKGSRRARTLQRLLTRKDRLIGTILVGNNLVNVAASSIATALAMAVWGQEGIAVATGAMTLALLIFSEIAPKTFASRRSEYVALAVAPLFSLLSKILFPVVSTVTFFSNGLLTILGIEPDTSARPSLSEEEIRSMLSKEADATTVAEHKRQMLHGIFQMGRQKVREIMVPRTRVEAIDVVTPLNQVAEIFVKSGFTRLPVFRGNLDRIAGTVHARDVLDALGSTESKGLGAVLREPFFVPESMDLETLLFEFKRRRNHMAVVVDEYGGVEGIATLEDVLEEIVGEIRDEHDLEGEPIRFLPGGVALLRGELSLRDANEKLGLALPLDGEVTIGGFAMEQLGRIPEPGETFAYGDVRFVIERVQRHRVALIRAMPKSNSKKK